MLQISNNLTSIYVLERRMTEKRLKKSDTLLTIDAICDKHGVRYNSLQAQKDNFCDTSLAGEQALSALSQFKEKRHSCGKHGKTKKTAKQVAIKRATKFLLAMARKKQASSKRASCMPFTIVAKRAT